MNVVKRIILSFLKIVGLCLLVLALIYVIWQPVLPSGWIIKKMADSIDPQNLELEQPKVIRFELSGKGGGIYNIVADNNRVDVIEGVTDRADLIVYMEAEDFNGLMFSFATGQADEYTFKKMVISKLMCFAGDIGVFEMLFKDQEGLGRR